MKVALTFQKNLDAALPASHTISIRFTPLAGSPLGDIQQIDSPQMRRDEAPSGDPLSAVPVPIMDNNFLVGLPQQTRGGQICVAGRGRYAKAHSQCK